MRVLKYKDHTYGVTPHWHEHVELHLLLESECTLKCGDEQIALRAGDCAVINGNELHQGCGAWGKGDLSLKRSPSPQNLNFSKIILPE